jgi:hypothetical protein
MVQIPKFIVKKVSQVAQNSIEEFEYQASDFELTSLIYNQRTHRQWALMVGQLRLELPSDPQGP